MPWQVIQEAYQARQERHAAIARRIHDLQLVSKELRVIQHARTDHLANRVLLAAGVMTEELRAVHKEHLLQQAPEPAASVEGAKAIL